MADKYYHLQGFKNLADDNCKSLLVKTSSEPNKPSLQGRQFISFSIFAMHI